MNFYDLKEHGSDSWITRKQLVLDNGYGISIIQGDGTYSTSDTYEVAILKDGNLCYTTPITDDVLGYQSVNEINSIIKELESYSKNQY